VQGEALQEKKHKFFRWSFAPSKKFVNYSLNDILRYDLDLGMMNKGIYRRTSG